MLGSSSPVTNLGSADVFDGPEALYYKIDIPGMSKTDVKVRVSEGNLVVSGDRHLDTFKDAQCIRSERFFGHFSRCVLRIRIPPLPHTFFHLIS